MKKTCLLLAVIFLLSNVAIAQGIVVESVNKGAAGEKAGIKEGDVLVSWERLSNMPANPDKHQGVFKSPFDLWWVEKEEAPRGQFNIIGKEKFFQVPPGDFWIQARPQLKDEALDLYNQGKKLFKDGKVDDGIEKFEKAAAVLKKDRETACWLYYKAAQLVAEKKDYDKAIVLCGKAKNKAVDVKDPGIVIMIWSFLGRTYKSRNDFQRAGDCFNEALKAAGENLAASFALNNLGILSKDRGDLKKAEEYFRKALAMRERLAPESLDLAASLNNLGTLIKEQGEFREAQEYYERSAAIIEKLAPESLQCASGLNNLGLFAYDRGNLAKAEGFYKRSLVIMEQLAPESLNAAAILTNLGALAYERGDLARAEEYHKRSLALREKLAPESLDVAACLNNLGVLDKDRGEFAKAEEYYMKSLAIKEKLSPGSLGAAAGLNNLGELEHARGDLKKAEEYFKESLALREKLAPESINVAVSLYNLGTLAQDRKDPAKAEEYFVKSLFLMKKLAPGSLNVSASLNSLGMVADDRGDFEQAEEYFKKSLAIREELAPGTSNLAEVLHSLGSISRKKADLPQTLSYLKRAVSALESQKTKLGGGLETKERFSSKYADYYRDLVEVETELKKNEEALGTLERFRARSLLEMLAERDLDFASDAPAELLSRQKELLFSYSKKQDELAELSLENDPSKIVEIRKTLNEISREQDEVREKMKRSSPKLASLQYPQPLDLDAMKKLIGKEALFLSYSTGEKKTTLFALLGDDLSVWALPVGRDILKDDVIYLRRLLADPKSDQKLLSQKSGQLYDLILKPAGKLIKKSNLVIICPDGPLHYIPFSALMKKPVVNVISATVLKELGEVPPSLKEGTIIAFGNPDYPGKDVKDTVVRSVTEGKPLAPLPATEIEVDNIGALYGDKATILTKEHATEEKAKSFGKNFSLVHFACHGILDERFPLDSGLALTIPGRIEEGKENGLLQAWEIFEGVRINADLVTLSACETGLGKEMGGEGLIGLTRAFQYAGARTILSSLWSVSDESTAILMRSFYSSLKQGGTKAEALSLAQTEMSRSKKYRHPFYWAGFVLNGDWK
jgi:CHAT domain-containing protein/Tfp pilus assembly protein PilF